MIRPRRAIRVDPSCIEFYSFWVGVERVNVEGAQYDPGALYYNDIIVYNTNICEESTKSS